MKLTHQTTVILGIAALSRVTFGTPTVYAQSPQSLVAQVGVGARLGVRAGPQNFYDHGSVRFDLRNQQIKSGFEQRDFQKDYQLRLRNYWDSRSSPQDFYDYDSVQFDLRNQRIKSGFEQRNQEARPYPSQQNFNYRIRQVPSP